MTPRLRRYEGNPILTPTSRWWEARWVFNCGAAVYQGRVHLLYRAQGLDFISRWGLATSDDGLRIVSRSQHPVFEPAVHLDQERLGCEDPRITPLGGRFYITYTAASVYPTIGPGRRRPSGAFSREGVPWRIRIGLASTRNFRTFRRHGFIFPKVDDKDAALFPEKINGRYYLLHRIYPNIHLAYSEDLRHWRNLGILMKPRQGMWDSERIGAGAPPVKTPYGWLLFYHGADHQRVYRIGLALLDLRMPQRVLARTEEPVLEPEEEYERRGQVPNVVFTCGAVELDGRYIVYYGAADTVIAAATIDQEEVLQWAASVSR